MFADPHPLQTQPAAQLGLSPPLTYEMVTYEMALPPGNNRVHAAGHEPGRCQSWAAPPRPTPLCTHSRRKHACGQTRPRSLSPAPVVSPVDNRLRLPTAQPERGP